MPHKITEKPTVPIANPPHCCCRASRIIQNTIKRMLSVTSTTDSVIGRGSDRFFRRRNSTISRLVREQKPVPCRAICRIAEAFLLRDLSSRSTTRLFKARDAALRPTRSGGVASRFALCQSANCPFFTSRHGLFAASGQKHSRRRPRQSEERCLACGVAPARSGGARALVGPRGGAPCEREQAGRPRRAAFRLRRRAARRDRPPAAASGRGRADFAPR